jgi:hypothetical protein
MLVNASSTQILSLVSAWINSTGMGNFVLACFVITLAAYGVRSIFNRN